MGLRKVNAWETATGAPGEFFLLVFEPLYAPSWLADLESFEADMKSEVAKQGHSLDVEELGHGDGARVLANVQVHPSRDAATRLALLLPETVSAEATQGTGDQARRTRVVWKLGEVWQITDAWELFDLGGSLFTRSPLPDLATLDPEDPASSPDLGGSTPGAEGFGDRLGQFGTELSSLVKIAAAAVVAWAVADVIGD